MERRHSEVLAICVHKKIDNRISTNSLFESTHFARHIFTSLRNNIMFDCSFDLRIKFGLTKFENQIGVEADLLPEEPPEPEGDGKLLRIKEVIKSHQRTL